MAIVRSFGALQAMTDPTPTWASSGAITLYERRQSYAALYASQPNVRICVDFLARNCAHLALHAFRRVSDTDRVRLRDHDLVRWVGAPNPATTRYRLIENLMSDLGIYFEAYWLKIRYQASTGREGIGLVRLPPDQMEPVGGLLPSYFRWTSGGRRRDLPLSEVVYFNGYNPDHALRGLSPLETLRIILAEEMAAGEHREFYWRNASRRDGVIERPAGAPKWTPEQKRDWRVQWQERFAGAGSAGLVPVLEDGMSFKDTSFSARDSEFILGGKLRREICAAEYHIPQPLVGILDHATFSNIKEQHKHLYQDTLGPWLKMVVEEIARQLLTECDDQRDVYTEFNIAEKMAGSFEEQAASLQLLVGRPIMTANEGRARLNLPAITDDPSADRLAAQQGGPATAADGGAAPRRPDAPDDQDPADDDDDGDADADRTAAPVIQATRARQDARLAKVPLLERPGAFYQDIDRWDRELAADLAPLVGAVRAADLAHETNVRTLTELAGLEGTL